MSYTYYYHNSKNYRQKCQQEKITPDYHTGLPLCLSTHNDIVQISLEHKDDYPWIKAHYAKIGLPVSKNIIWSNKTPNPRQNYKLSSFIYEENTWNNNKQLLDIVNLLDNKNTFLPLAQQHGIDIPDTHYFDNKKLITYSTYPYVLKTAFGHSGLGNYLIEQPSNLDKVPPNTPLNIQPFLENRVQDCSVHFYVKDQKAHYTWTIVDTISSRFGWEGGKPAPLPSHFKEKHQDFANHIASMGMKGHFCFDFILTSDQQFLLNECNPRFCASSYPSLVDKRLQLEGKWLFKKVYFNHEDFLQRITSLTYDKAKGYGVIIIGWTFHAKQARIMLIGNDQEIERLNDQIQAHCG